MHYGHKDATTVLQLQFFELRTEQPGGQNEEGQDFMGFKPCSPFGASHVSFNRFVPVKWPNGYYSPSTSDTW